MSFANRSPASADRSASSGPVIEALETRTLLSVPRFDHVVVVVEENKSPMQVIGNSAAPYITSLANNGAYFNNAHAEFRPSQPNYIALFAGSNYGVTTNDVANLGAKANLGAQLIAAGRSFTGYAEGLPAVGSAVATSGRYARKHNPWVDFSNVPAASNRPFTDFPTDFTKLPTVSFVVPNLDDDSHDGTLAASDSWLNAHISAYANWAKTHNSLLIVTYDEGDLADTTNHIPTIFYGANVKTGSYSDPINHYNVLRTMEDMYALPALNNAASAATIDYAWGTSTSTPLGAPTNLTVRPSTSVANAMDVAWNDNATSETGYKIERSTDGVNFSIVGGAGINATFYRNTGLTAGRRYWYRVYAVDAAGNRSPNSNVADAVMGTGGTPTPPATPSGLAATVAGSSSINLSWADNSSNETGFRIERSTDGTNFSFLASVGSNVHTYASGGLSASTKYYYRVQATGSAGNSGYSNVASATTSGSTGGSLSAPSNLSVRPSASVANAIDVSWSDNASGETGYKIERSTDGVNFSIVGGTGANATFYRNTGLTAGRRYWYRAYAVDAAGNKSGYSNVADTVAGSSGTPTPPAAPSGLAASAAGSSSINLSWTDNSSNETGFRIERSTDGSNFGFLGSVGANVRSYTSGGLAASTKYYYRVLATGGDGNSGYSNVASATTSSGGSTGAPAAPTNLSARASATVANAIDVFWTDNANNETGYKIERSTDGRTFSILGGGGANSTFYRNTAVTPGRLYYYRVYCVNAAGNSGYSNIVSAIYPSAALGPVFAPIVMAPLAKLGRIIDDPAAVWAGA
ncbi:MAG TPA: alkaline phosphatase family protein [Tepidisphaeraceae bacterium]